MSRPHPLGPFGPGAPGPSGTPSVRPASLDDAPGKRRLIDWIWHVRGSAPLAPEQSNREAFDRLDPLFRQTGTTHRRTGDELIFDKKDPAAQDKMSIFDAGTLRIVHDATGPVLRYHLVSRSLLLCFLAPLFFLALAQATTLIVNHEKASAAAAKKAEKVSAATRKLAKEKAALPMNPIDKFLGAPAPAPKKKTDKDGDGGGGEEGGGKKPSATPAYVFAAIFAVLYLIGRIFQARGVKRLFQQRLSGDQPA